MTLKTPPPGPSVPDAAAPVPLVQPADDGTLPGLPGWLMAITAIAATVALGLAGFTGYLFYRQGSSPNADGNCLSFMKSPKPSQVDWCHPR